MMKKGILRQILVVLTVLATITVNLLAEALPFYNVSTKEISDSFTVFFVPAGYVFSIWGLIYLGLIAYGIFQAMPSQRENPRVRRVDGLFILSSVANCLWLVKWHHRDFLSSLLLMFVLLTSLIMIYLDLGIGTRKKVSKAETWMVRIPFSIYLGWISVATIANVTAVLSFYQWNGWGIAPQVWSVIMMGVVAVLAALITFTKGDSAFLLVLIWALAGIAVKFQSTQLVFTGAVIAACVVALMAVFVFLRKVRTDN